MRWCATHCAGRRILCACRRGVCAGLAVLHACAVLTLRLLSCEVTSHACGLWCVTVSRVPLFSTLSGIGAERGERECSNCDINTCLMVHPTGSRNQTRGRMCPAGLLAGLAPARFAYRRTLAPRPAPPCCARAVGAVASRPPSRASAPSLASLVLGAPV